MEHLGQEPPTHRILNWKYLKQKPPKLTEEVMSRQHRDLAMTMGQGSSRMPEHLKTMVRWAEEQVAKLNKKKT